MKRSLAWVVVAGLGCTAAAGGASTGAVTAPRSGVRDASSIRCPSRAPQLPAARKSRLGNRFADPGATIILLCRYQGLNAASPLRLARARRITRLATIKKLTRELDSLPLRGGVYHCPYDDGSKILLIFGYGSREPERVVVGLRGCMGVTNGRIGTLAGPSRDGVHFIQRLTTLTS